jgi:formate dehydrogenase subunit gamma
MATQVSQPRLGKITAAERAAPAEPQVVRFDAHQRIQHFLMMSSFIVLALTGLPQRFSELAVSQWWVDTLGGLETVRTIHRIAAIVMLSDCAYHIGYLIYRIGVQRKFGCFRMVPTPKDLTDAIGTVRYFLGLAQEKPKFDRFNYLEKFDYWAVFWGVAIIGGSGLILMFPVIATSVLPGEAVSVALILHADEAILATGWIIIMHMFNVHFAPWVFPFNPAIFTGKMSAKRYAEDHPLEWVSLQKPQDSGAEDVRGTVTRDSGECGGNRRGFALADRARALVAFSQKKARVMTDHPLVPLVVVVGIVMAGPLGWSSGSNGGSSPTLDTTPTPTPVLVVSHEPDTKPTPSAEPAPPGPAALAHKTTVLEEFLCTNCHGTNSGWLMPEDCTVSQDQACESCHAREQEPGPVTVHMVPGDTATNELCTLCHGDPDQFVPRAVAPHVGPDASCSSCHYDQPAEPPADHEGRSVATCTVCHETSTLFAQPVAHTVEGWQECSFCHAVDRLAPLEDGHNDIPDTECVQCHDTSHSPPLPRTYMLDYADTVGGCASCHSQSQLSPPVAHESARDDALCTLCHSPGDTSTIPSPH